MFLAFILKFTDRGSSCGGPLPRFYYISTKFTVDFITSLISTNIPWYGTISKDVRIRRKLERGSLKGEGVYLVGLKMWGVVSL